MYLQKNSPIPPHKRKLALNVAIVLCVLVLVIPGLAIAQGSLPYEAGLAKLKTSLTGPVPFMISLMGIVGCGAMLIFGGEISGFLRTLVFIVLVISIIVGATQIIELLGGKWTGDAVTQVISPVLVTSLS